VLPLSNELDNRLISWTRRETVPELPWLRQHKTLRDHLFLADFEQAWKDVENLPVDEIPDGSSMNDPNIINALRLRSMAAEVCDYFGRYSKARDFVARTGELCETGLRALPPGRVGERLEPRVLQQIWVVLQAGLCEYRANKFDSAFAMFDLCNLAIGRLEQPRWGTRARIQYSLGLVHRERYQLHDAIHCFVESTELAYKSFVRNTEVARGAEISKMNQIAIARSIGMGLASIYNTLGRHDLAVPLLMAAKAMLPTKPMEKLISTHIDMIEATLVRAEARSAEANEEVLKRLLDCHATFRDHPFYRARAAYCLAGEYIQRARPNPAKPLSAKDEDYLRSARDLLKDLDFQRTGNFRFPYQALLLQSHIERKRGNYVGAEERASEALREVSSTRLPGLFLDLCIARGLARLGLRNTKRAVEDFTEGLKVAEKSLNRRMEALFLLWLCQCHTRMKGDLEAAYFFNRYEEVEKFTEVKTADVRQLAEETRAVYKRTPDLVLTLKDNFDPTEVEKRFRRFLIDWARSRSKNDVQAAKRLKISRQTLYNWLQDTGPSPS
jgi:tetratricopeptide (TPR) repeat protein